MRLKIGDNAGLDVFAETYVQLFGDKIAPQSQKQLCLALYREYAKIAQTVTQGPYKSLAEARKKAYSCEAHIPPWEKQAFQRVWDPAAPDRCAECAKALERPGRGCSSVCEYAGTKHTCRGCGAELDRVHPYCRTCKRGASPLAPHNKRARDQSAQMSMAQRLWFGGAATQDPAHEPAWKRRRRS